LTVSWWAPAEAWTSRHCERLVSDNLSKPHLAKSPLPAAVVSVTLCFVVKDSAGQKLVIQI
jgi:hypothetical protein